jgi:hypothetical protein
MACLLAAFLRHRIERIARRPVELGGRFIPLILVDPSLRFMCEAGVVRDGQRGVKLVTKYLAHDGLFLISLLMFEPAQRKST